MLCLPAISPGRRLTRPALAAERAQEARALLSDCRLCAHDCGVNRLAGERGLCHAGDQTRFFSAQVEVGDEPELVPAFNVALSGCDLRCDFCITGGPSWNPRAGAVFDPSLIAAQARGALAQGARSVMLLGGEPTIHLPAALEFVAELPTTAKLVWKTNAHGSAQARELLEDIFDVWVADYKFGNEHCAQRLAKVPNYLEVVQENLHWASRHADLIVRHLLMPGHVECCWKPAAEWLATEMPEVKVSLRTGFWPAWHAARHPELRGVLQADEEAEALKIARDLNLVEPVRSVGAWSVRA